MNRHNIQIAQGENLEYLTFSSFENLPGIRHLFSTRVGGVSEGIFATMNLSFTRGDKEEAVLENYRRIAEALAMEQKEASTKPVSYTLKNFVCSDQTHTTNIRVVTKEDAGKGVVRERDYKDVDGLITKEKGLILSTFYADCVPLYFVDPVKKVIGLSHSGWRGTAEKMGKCTVERMKEVFGCNPVDIYAAIGPSICQNCYEVSADVAEAFSETFHGDRMKLNQILMPKEGQKFQLNLWKANELILLETGILPQHIEVTDYCTSCHANFLFSHRASNGKRGNLGAFLVLE